jgi:hypothetical protein
MIVGQSLMGKRRRALWEGSGCAEENKQLDSAHITATTADRAG